MRKYLVLEDDQEFVEQTYKPAQRDSIRTDSPFELVYTKNIDEARSELAISRFNGVILDLRLTKENQAEGNEIAKQIHRDYFMPIAIVSGFLGELDESLKDIIGEGNGLFRIFNKNGYINESFDFLLEIENSGIPQIFGPSGEMTGILSEIYWKHLAPVLKRRHGSEHTTQENKRILRHTVSHMMGALQSNASGDWDNFLPDEIYIWPSICPNEMTGDIYIENNKETPINRHFLFVTPACDIASKSEDGSMRHFIEILPFSDFPSLSKIRGKLAKKEHKYHVLPPTEFFNGGVLDFSKLTTINATEVDHDFLRVGSIIEPYWREIINRLGAWLGRQGTPEFEKEPLLESITEQWPKTAEH